MHSRFRIFRVFFPPLTPSQEGSLVWRVQASSDPARLLTARCIYIYIYIYRYIHVKLLVDYVLAFHKAKINICEDLILAAKRYELSWLKLALYIYVSMRWRRWRRVVTYPSRKKKNVYIALETYLQMTDAANVALLYGGTTLGTWAAFPPWWEWLCHLSSHVHKTEWQYTGWFFKMYMIYTNPVIRNHGSSRRFTTFLLFYCFCIIKMIVLLRPSTKTIERIHA